MKSCIEWRKNFKYLPQIDQFNIDYKENKSKKLLEFLDVYAQTQRVNIRVENNVSKEDIELIEEIYKLGKYQIALLFDDFLPTNIGQQEIQKLTIPYFFGRPAITWEEVYFLLNIGVSDIYISNQLGFDLERLVQVIPMEVQIRCFVNVCQSFWDDSLGLKAFFIRPEDIDLYGEYIDVFEFWKSVDNQSTLYEIYFHDREWNGNLREIIKGLKLDINSYYILGDEWAKRRIGCQKKCLKGKKCELCKRLVEFAKTLEYSKDYEVFKRRMIDGERSLS